LGGLIVKLDDRSKRDLLNLPQVVGVGYGFKVVGGIQTDQEAVVVLVSKKLLPETTTIKLSDITPTDKEDIYEATVQIDGSLVSDIDTNSLAKKIKGKTVNSAKKVLETTNNFSGLTLKNWPKIPVLSYLLTFNPDNIQISIDVDK